MVNEYKKQMEEAKKEGSIWVIKFSEDWCTPCRILDARLKELQKTKKYKGKLVISTISSKDAVLLEKYRKYFRDKNERDINTIPDYLVVVRRNGNFYRTGRYLGLSDVKSLEKQLDKKLKKDN